jgi:hypothetical protein
MSSVEYMSRERSVIQDNPLSGLFTSGTEEEERGKRKRDEGKCCVCSPSNKSLSEI